jgi:hypothetical protein
LFSVSLLCLCRVPMIAFIFSLLLWCAFSNPCLLHCAPVFSSVTYSVFFWGGGSVCPGGLSWFILGMGEGYCVTLGFHLFGLPKFSQAHLEPAAGSLQQQHGCGYPPVLSVYHGMEKSSMG